MAAAAAHVVEDAVYLALVTGEAHGHALAGSLGAHYFALLAVLDLVAILEGLTRPREVDLLAHRVAAQQRRWRLAAYLLRPRATHRGCAERRGTAGVVGSCGWLCVAAAAAHVVEAAVYLALVAGEAH